MNKQIMLILSATIFLLIQSCTGSHGDSPSTISFAIEGLQGDTIRLWQTEPMGINSMRDQLLPVDEAGYASTELDFPGNSFIRVQVGKFSFPIFNTPGARLSLKGKAGDLANTLVVSGKGSQAITHVWALDSIIQKYLILDGRPLLQLDSAAFWTRIAALGREVDSLNMLLVKERINPELESLLVLESEQKVNVHILNYALVKGYTDPWYAIEVPYDEDMFRSFSPSYSLVLAMNYERHIVRPAWGAAGASGNDSIANIFPLILSNNINSLDIPGFARDFYLYRLLISYFGVNLSSPAIEDVYMHWLERYPHSMFRNTIERARENMTVLARGEPAPNITGIKPNGESFTLEELKGKVVYVDVWATWCSGCVEKLPNMYALREAFSDDPHVAFLFVSVDKDLGRWKDYVSKLPDGLHINAHDTELFRDYMIGGIPHYILIDASGNMLLSKAPGPDSRDMRAMLDNP